MHILLNEDTTEKEMNRKSDIAKDTKVRNFEEHVTTAKKKDILLEIVPNEAISHNKDDNQRKGKNNEQNNSDQEALYTSNDEDRCGWIIDSGATQHMTFERTRLSNYTEFKKPCIVNIGDNRSILAYGKRTYHVKAAVDDHTQNLSLQEVLCLPELEKKLAVSACNG